MRFFTLVLSIATTLVVVQRDAVAEPTSRIDWTVFEQLESGTPVSPQAVTTAEAQLAAYLSAREQEMNTLAAAGFTVEAVFLFLQVLDQLNIFGPNLMHASSTLSFLEPIAATAAKIIGAQSCAVGVSVGGATAVAFTASFSFLAAP